MICVNFDSSSVLVPSSSSVEDCTGYILVDANYINSPPIEFSSFADVNAGEMYSLGLFLVFLPWTLAFAISAVKSAIRAI